MKRKSSYTCGLEAALTVIAGKWKFLILWNLASGPRRFGELRRLVAGVSEKMLIQELKEMVADGVVVRQDYHEIPPKVEYRLTDFGMSLAEACRPLCEWGSEHMERIETVTEPSRPQRPSGMRTVSSPRNNFAIMTSNHGDDHESKRYPKSN